MFTKNGEDCVVLINTDRLDHFDRQERERSYLLLIDDATCGPADVAAGLTFDSDTVLA